MKNDCKFNPFATSVWYHCRQRKNWRIYASPVAEWSSHICVTGSGMVKSSLFHCFSYDPSSCRQLRVGYVKKSYFKIQRIHKLHHMNSGCHIFCVSLPVHSASLLIRNWQRAQAAVLHIRTSPAKQRTEDSGYWDEDLNQGPPGSKKSPLPLSQLVQPKEHTISLPHLINYAFTSKFKPMYWIWINKQTKSLPQCNQWLFSEKWLQV